MSAREAEEVAGEPLRAGAVQLAVDSPAREADHLPDAQQKTRVAQGTAERQRDVGAIGNAAARGERDPETGAGGGAPAGVRAEGCVAGPDAAHVGEDRAAEVEHLGEGPVEVQA